MFATGAFAAGKLIGAGFCLALGFWAGQKVTRQIELLTYRLTGR